MARNMDFNYTAKDMESRIDQYFQDCDNAGKNYTWPGLAIALEVPRNRLDILRKLADEYTSTPRRKGLDIDRDDEDIQWVHLLQLQKAGTRIQDQLEQRKDAMSIFLLKQAAYGGYSDKPANETGTATVTVKVKLDGLGKGVDPGG